MNSRYWLCGEGNIVLFWISLHGLWNTNFLNNVKHAFYVCWFIIEKCSLQKGKRIMGNCFSRSYDPEYIIFCLFYTSSVCLWICTVAGLLFMLLHTLFFACFTLVQCVYDWMSFVSISCIGFLLNSFTFIMIWPTSDIS